MKIFSEKDKAFPHVHILDLYEADLELVLEALLYAAEKKTEENNSDQFNRFDFHIEDNKYYKLKNFFDEIRHKYK